VAASDRVGGRLLGWRPDHLGRRVDRVAATAVRGGPRPGQSRGRKDQLAFDIAQQDHNIRDIPVEAIPGMAAIVARYHPDARCDDLT
jgi:hypothetical protein